MITLQELAEKLNLPLAYVYGILAVIAVVGIVFLVLFIGRLAGCDSVRKLLHRFAFFSVLLKALALAGTYFLAQCDFYAVFTIFDESLSLDKDQVKFLSYTFAAFLEGFAFVLGIFLSRAMDSTSYRDTAKRAYWFGVLICVSGLVGAWSLAVAQRYNLVRLAALAEATEGTVLTFWQVVSNSKSEDIFMMVSPILTSVLAFSLSWLAFPSYSLDNQAREVEYQQGRYLRFRAKYGKLLMAYQQKKTKLWTALSGNEMDMPEDSNIYQSRCQQLIRQKTVNACVGAFYGEFGQYNKRIEAELSAYILELSERSTLPHMISTITVEEVLEKYDSMMKDKGLEGDIWDSQKLRQDKKARLQRDLNNAACQAEFWFSPNRKK